MPVLAPQQNRQAGEYTSSEVAAPARGQNEATMFRAQLDLAPNDLSDTTLGVSVTLEGSVDGTNWALFASIEGWTGGMVGRDGNITPPRLSWAASNNRVLTKVRLRWTQTKTARIGANLEFEAQTF